MTEKLANTTQRPYLLLLENSILYNWPRIVRRPRLALDLANCTVEGPLPEDTQLRMLSLVNSPNITTLPGKLKVEEIELDIRAKYTNAPRKKRCGWCARTIYCVENHGVHWIVAGCFFGPLPEFISAVAEKYKHSPVFRDKYIEDARCLTLS